MQGSAIQTARKILLGITIIKNSEKLIYFPILILHAEKSVQQLSALPFVSLLTNCIVWSLYGTVKNDNTVLAPNACGVITGIICVYSYNKFTSSPPVRLYVAASVIVIFAFIFATNNDYNSIGLIGCGLAVVLSGSPLATVRTVIKDKSTLSLPFLPSVFTWLNACSWTLYGLQIANDPMVNIYRFF